MKELRRRAAELGTDVAHVIRLDAERSRRQKRTLKVNAATVTENLDTRVPISNSSSR
jgi:hypothetical protein